MSIIKLLENVQWRHDKNPMTCPYCDEPYKHGHSQNCEISRRINQLKAAEHLAKNNPDFDFKKLFCSLFGE